MITRRLNMNDVPNTVYACLDGYSFLEDDKEKGLEYIPQHIHRIISPLSREVNFIYLFPEKEKKNFFSSLKDRFFSKEKERLVPGRIMVLPYEEWFPTIKAHNSFLFYAEELSDEEILHHIPENRLQIFPLNLKLARYTMDFFHQRGETVQDNSLLKELRESYAKRKASDSRFISKFYR